MTAQHFVNLMPGNNKTVLGRKSGILNKILIDPEVTPSTPVRIFQDFGEMVIRVVPEEKYVEDKQFKNPFDDWIVNSDSDELVLWIATPRLGIISTIKNEMKVLRIDGGFLVALLKGKIAVETAEGEIKELSRRYKGEAEVRVLNTPEQFPIFNLRKVKNGFAYEHYSWNVLFDISIKQNVYGERGEFRYEDAKVSGLDFRPTDYHLLDADIYEEQFQQYLDLLKEKERLEEERRERRLAEEAELVKQRAEKVAQKKNRGYGTGPKSPGKKKKGYSMNQSEIDFLTEVGVM